MNNPQHWNAIYSRKAPNEHTWYQPSLHQSMAWMAQLGLDKTAPLIDVGGGASTWVDELLELGYTALSVVDLSRVALEHSQARLGQLAGEVTWIEGDITQLQLEPSRFALWHDRAVFHFLTEGQAREAYLATLRQCLQPRGYVILATFAPDGPETCSGLPVVRYSAEALLASLGPEFELLEHTHELHTTPRGGVQSFTFALMRRREVAV